MGHDKKLKEHADEISKFQDEADAAQAREAKIESERKKAVDEREKHAAACTKQQKEDAAMIEDLKSKHTSAAQKCLDEAKRVKEEHDLAQKKKSDELDDAKKKHDDAIIAHAVSMNAKKEECE